MAPVKFGLVGARVLDAARTSATTGVAVEVKS